MPRPNRCALVALLALAPAAALAVPRIEVIDRGVPTDGVRTMDGYRGYVLRVVSDGAPIGTIALDGLPPLDSTAGGFLRDVAQRWTDPSGTGDCTVRSPGPIDADNTFPTVSNFDSHFLPGVAGPDNSFREFANPAFNVADDPGPPGFSTAGNPIPSDGFVGYGDAPDGFPPAVGDEYYYTGLQAAIGLPVPVQSVDLAYVVTDSSFGYAVFVQLTDFGADVLTGSVSVPEPGGLIAGAVALLTAGLQRVRRARRTTTVRVRLARSVIPPTSAAAGEADLESTDRDVGARHRRPMPRRGRRARRRGRGDPDRAAWRRPRRRPHGRPAGGAARDRSSPRHRRARPVSGSAGWSRRSAATAAV